MDAARLRLPMRPALMLLCLAGVMAALAAAALQTTQSSQAFCQGNHCLPAAGYALDTTFDCGSILNYDCFANGTRSRSNAVRHHFGWASAAYNGAGSTGVRLCADDGSLCYFGGSGTNLIRACYYDSCVSQGAKNLYLSVGNNGPNAHTIFGHGKA